MSERRYEYYGANDLAEFTIKVEAQGDKWGWEVDSCIADGYTHETCGVAPTMYQATLDAADEIIRRCDAEAQRARELKARVVERQLESDEASKLAMDEPKLKPAADVWQQIEDARVQLAVEDAALAAREFTERIMAGIKAALVGGPLQVAIHAQDRHLSLLTRMLDEGRYHYHVKPKGSLGQLRDGGTTTPVLVDLLAGPKPAAAPHKPVTDEDMALMKEYGEERRKRLAGQIGDR